MKTSKIGPSMESLSVFFFSIFCPNYQKFCFEQLVRNSSLIGDISDIFSTYTKFPVSTVSRGGDKACFFISRGHMINESSIVNEAIRTVFHLTFFKEKSCSIKKHKTSNFHSLRSFCLQKIIAFVVLYLLVFVLLVIFCLFCVSLFCKIFLKKKVR